MKVTIITGSAHRHGTSSLLADKFAQGAVEAGHSVYRFDSAFKQVHPCIGCDTCLKGNGCVFKDDMLELNPHILDADVIVFVSPIYYYNINAQVKAVIDRFYANNSALQGDKKAILLLSMADDCTESAEGAEVFFKHYTHYMKWENAGTIAAINCMTREDMEHSQYPALAYEMGKSLK